MALFIYAGGDDCEFIPFRDPGHHGVQNIRVIASDSLLDGACQLALQGLPQTEFVGDRGLVDEAAEADQPVHAPEWRFPTTDSRRANVTRCSF